jgi:hypothetical protein
MEARWAHNPEGRFDSEAPQPVIIVLIALLVYILLNLGILIKSPGRDSTAKFHLLTE